MAIPFTFVCLCHFQFFAHFHILHAAKKKPFVTKKSQWKNGRHHHHHRYRGFFIELFPSVQERIKLPFIGFYLGFDTRKYDPVEVISSRNCCHFVCSKGGENHNTMIIIIEFFEILLSYAQYWLTTIAPSWYSFIALRLKWTFQEENRKKTKSKRFLDKCKRQTC